MSSKTLRLKRLPNCKHVNSLTDSNKKGCSASLKNFVDPFCSSWQVQQCNVSYTVDSVSQNQKWRVCMQEENGILLLRQVGMAAAIQLLIFHCALDRNLKHTCTYISVLCSWHTTCICFPPNNQIQRTRLGQTENDCAFQDLPAGWLEEEWFYLGASYTIHAVYSRNYLKQHTDIQEGFDVHKTPAQILLPLLQ